jgi:uncharacterized protein (DUF924 family)
MTPDDVLHFWFGELDADGLASAGQTELWFRKDLTLDAQIVERFGQLWSELMRGAHQEWLAQPRSLLAYVIVLDQLSRNMFRGKSQAFAGDTKALAAAKQGLERSYDSSLRPHERVFLFMPFMHSERLDDQERCVELFTRLRDQSEGRVRQAVENNVDYAVRHRDVIAQWGRFPHRNQILDRTSTTEEFEFLKQPNSSF